MNPYTNQGNQNNAYMPYNQQQYMPDMGFSPQKMESNSNNGSPQQPFDPSLMANLVAKRQMYGQSPVQQQPFVSPVTSMASPTMQSPRQSPNNMQQPFRVPNTWNKQMPRMDERQQYMMQQQQQQLKKPMNDVDIVNENKSVVNDSELNTKRVEIILALNIELFRLCIESQRTGVNVEPNLALYQAKLQSNLTYLATMADISMVKPGEDYKAPSPPDLSPLPPPTSDIGKKIHDIINTAKGLFESPRHQQQNVLRQQAAAMRQQQQQQFLNNTTKSPPSSIPTRHVDPQSMLRQAQQAQQQNIMQQQQRQQHMMMGLNTTMSPQSSIDSQQLSPNDVLQANNNMMMNPNTIMNNMYNNNNTTTTTEDPNHYSNVMIMMQRLQQQQQQQQQQQ